MIKSMTGYGKAIFRQPNCQITLEIKTTNHKFFDFSSRICDTLRPFEEKIKDYIHTKIDRGRLNLFMSCDLKTDSKKNLEIDANLAKFYFKQLNKLRKSLDLKEDVTFQQLITMPDVIRYKAKEKDINKFWPMIKSAIDEGLHRLIESRSREGKNIQRDLSGRIRDIEISVGRIIKRAPDTVKIYKEQLRQKTQELLKRPMDKNRLEEEAALFAKGCDIHEELIRLSSHIKIFKEAMLKKDASGKYLDFISQELQREANTVASKACDFLVQKEVIAIKSQVDKIREQVQNIE